MKMGFSITGEFLTEHSRNLVLEDNHVSAIRTLECLQGFSMDYIYKILRGDARLEGVNSVQLFEDNDKEYKKKLNYKYSGLVRKGSNFYRPYAVVASYGEVDMMFACGAEEDKENGVTCKGPTAFTKYHHERAKFYASDKINDIVQPVDVGKLKGDMASRCMCLFRKVDSVPDFIAINFNNNENYQKAFDETIEFGNGVEIRGYVEGGFASEKAKQDERLKEMKNRILKDKISSSRKKHKEEQAEFKRLGLDEYGCDEYGLRPDEDHAKDRLDPKFKKHKYGWVMPNGDVYSCDYEEHRYVADIICKCVLGIKNASNPERTLEMDKCLKLGSAVRGGYVGGEFDLRGKYSQAQYDVVWDWCKKNKVDFPQWIWENN